MSDEPTQQPDEQIKLLREIRDILAEQTKLVDQQWVENKALGDASRRANFRLSILSTVALVGALLLWMFVNK